MEYLFWVLAPIALGILVIAVIIGCVRGLIYLNESFKIFKIAFKTMYIICAVIVIGFLFWLVGLWFGAWAGIF